MPTTCSRHWVALLTEVFSFLFLSFLPPSLLSVSASTSSSAHKLMRHRVNSYNEGKFRLTKPRDVSSEAGLREEWSQCSIKKEPKRYKQPAVK